MLPVVSVLRVLPHEEKVKTTGKYLAAEVATAVVANLTSSERFLLYVHIGTHGLKDLSSPSRVNKYIRTPCLKHWCRCNLPVTLDTRAAGGGANTVLGVTSAAKGIGDNKRQKLSKRRRDNKRGLTVIPFARQSLSIRNTIIGNQAQHTCFSRRCCDCRC